MRIAVGGSTGSKISGPRGRAGPLYERPRWLDSAGVSDRHGLSLPFSSQFVGMRLVARRHRVHAGVEVIADFVGIDEIAFPSVGVAGHGVLDFAVDRKSVPGTAR